MSEIEWREPRNSHRGALKRFLEVLKTRPGEWAVYPTTSRQMASNIRNGNPGVEAVSRINKSTGLVEVFVRWVGVKP